MAGDRYYIGVSGGAHRTVFAFNGVPTAASHPQFLACIGPFRTKKAAFFMALYGRSNPHCRTVQDAERLTAHYD